MEEDRKTKQNKNTTTPNPRNFLAKAQIFKTMEALCV